MYIFNENVTKQNILILIQVMINKDPWLTLESFIIFNYLFFDTQNRLSKVTPNKLE